MKPPAQSIALDRSHVGTAMSLLRLTEEDKDFLRAASLGKAGDKWFFREADAPRVKQVLQIQ